jgi:hypothetical protein
MLSPMNCPSRHALLLSAFFFFGCDAGTGDDAASPATGSGGASATGPSSGGAGSTVDVSAGCAPGQLTMTGTLQGPYDTLEPTIDGRQYFIQVNEWNATAPQTVDYGGAFVYKMVDQEAMVSTGGGPTGFPSIFIGANSSHATTGSNLPKQVSALTTVPTTWVWNDNGTLADNTANSYNATYDVWFSIDPVPADEGTMFGPSGGFLMVWLHKPEDAQPLGKVLYPAVTIPGVSGSWDVWVGKNGAVPCISYVRTQTTLSLSFDLNSFIKDAVANRPNTIQSAWHLTNIFTGFEIWRGGVDLESTGFCAAVN